MNTALELWKEKLEFLQREQAIAVESGQKFALKKEIDEAKTKIAELEQASKSHQPVFHADTDRILRYVPEKLIGREAELETLNEAWAKVQANATPRPHVLTFVALGGEGKTSLVSHWTAKLSNQGWPGCEAAFAWSFYSQGTREQAAASSDLFLRDALIYFGDTEMANSPQTAYDKAKRLARLVGEQRALLILDGLEPLQYAPPRRNRGS